MSGTKSPIVLEEKPHNLDMLIIAVATFFFEIYRPFTCRFVAVSNQTWLVVAILILDVYPSAHIGRAWEEERGEICESKVKMTW